MFTISLGEMTERIRAAVSSAIHEKIANFNLICLHQDERGGASFGSAKGKRSEYAVALLQYQQPGTREIKHAAVLIDDVNEWPLGVAFEDESMWIDESCDSDETVQGPFYNEMRTWSLTQKKTAAGTTYALLKNEIGEGMRFHVKDTRGQVFAL